jgi:acetoin utilization protein AcuB
MRIKNWMVKQVVTIHRDSLSAEALSLMKKYSIRHIPVVDGDQLVGLVTESDLRQVMISSLLESIKVDQIMIKNPVTIGPRDSLEEAARLIYRFKIGGLPVVDKGKLVGILTTPDILAAFIQFMGVLQASSRLEVKLAERPKAFEEASGIIQNQGGEIISVGMVGKGKKKTYIFRLKRCPLKPIVQVLEAKGHHINSFQE